MNLQHLESSISDKVIKQAFTYSERKKYILNRKHIALLCTFMKLTVSKNPMSFTCQQSKTNQQTKEKCRKYFIMKPKPSSHLARKQ